MGLMLRGVRRKTGSVGMVSFVSCSSTCILSSPVEFVNSGGGCGVSPGGLSSTCIALSRSGGPSTSIALPHSSGDIGKSGTFPSGARESWGAVDGGGANIEAMGQS
jgi:hypothetical protein